VTVTRLRALPGSLAAAGLLAAAAGCVSGSDIDQLHQHIGAVEKQVEALKKELRRPPQPSDQPVIR